MIETARWRLIALFACAAVVVSQLDGAEVPGEQKLQFGQHVHPILAAHCTACHGAAAPAAELNLTTEASLMKGSVNGPVVIPGAPEKSVLFHKISNRSMPPHGVNRFGGCVLVDHNQLEAVSGVHRVSLDTLINRHSHEISVGICYAQLE